jgi:Ca-activated chloride channel family protein
MFIERVKRRNSKYTITLVSLLLACFICTVVIFRTKIIVQQLKYNGDAAYGQGIFGDAEMYYRKALHKVTGQYVVQYNLGNTYYKQQRYAEAVESYLQALKTDNDSLKALTWNNLGNVFYKQNKLLLSAMAYKNALLIIKDNLKARRNFLFVLNKLDDKRVKIIPVTNNNRHGPDKKDEHAQHNEKDSHGGKSNNKNSAGEQKISDKAVNDIFKLLNQNEDDAKAKIGKLKHAPVTIKSTEPDY